MIKFDAALRSLTLVSILGEDCMAARAWDADPRRYGGTCSGSVIELKCAQSDQVIRQP